MNRLNILLVLLLARRVTLSTGLPFGPALLAGTLAAGLLVSAGGGLPGIG